MEMFLWGVAIDPGGIACARINEHTTSHKVPLQGSQSVASRNVLGAHSLNRLADGLHTLISALDHGLID